MDLSFPHFVKYLFWGSQHDKGFFEEPKAENEDEQIQIEISNQPSAHGDESSENLEFEGQNIFTEEQFSYDTSKQNSAAGQSPTPSEVKLRHRRPTRYYLNRISKEQVW